jgi:hypothetical protein
MTFRGLRIPGNSLFLESLQAQPAVSKSSINPAGAFAGFGAIEPHLPGAALDTHNSKVAIVRKADMSSRAQKLDALPFRGPMSLARYKPEQRCGRLFPAFLHL